MENNLAAIGMIHGMGIFGNALLPDLKIPMAATRDVGDYAAQRLLDLDFSGKQTRELLGERDLSMTEATAVIARGIGKPDLRYEQFPYDQVQQALTQMGVPPKGAAMYIEMYKAINAGVLVPLEPRSPENTTPTSFEKFVQDVFAAAYHGKAQSAVARGGTGCACLQARVLEESMTTIKAMRLASVVTAINVLVASGFSIVGIIRPQYLVPAESVPTQASLILAMYAAARTIPLALFALWAIYKQATPALVLLGALAGAMQLLDAGIGLFEHDLGKCAGPLFIAVLQFFVVYVLHRGGSRRKPSADRLSP